MLRSPVAARAIPFVVWVILTALQGQLGSASPYWLYALKTVVGGWLIWSVRKVITELRWTFSPVSIAVGVVVFLVWVGLDGHHPTLNQLLSKAETPVKEATVWNPFRFFGEGSPIAWSVVVLRIVGTAVAVPPIEEAFYRSLVYRSIVQPDFEKCSLRQFSPKAFLITSVVFGLVHPDQWVAGIFCGVCYQWLVLRKGDLGEAMVAHGITNLLLGVYVVTKGAWQFW